MRSQILVGKKVKGTSAAAKFMPQSAVQTVASPVASLERDKAGIAS